MDVRKIERPYANDVRVFKAFCDENRLRILDLLRSGEKCACRLLEDLHIGQSTLSHHMKILCESGVVHSRIEGKWTYYSIDTDGIQYAKGLLEDLAKVEEIADQCDNDEAQ
ncbi:MAG: metalloregulator ArsR/SmtB family transcription factor [Limnochordia bacterium]|jgi:ArsR family transcriptional regulator|nr:metalloregulator ArsR/SmtB family transcription factor [Limnochordia bacterium]